MTCALWWRSRRFSRHWDAFDGAMRSSLLDHEDGADDGVDVYAFGFLVAHPPNLCTLDNIVTRLEDVRSRPEEKVT